MIHPSWNILLTTEFEKDYWQSLIEFVKQEYAHSSCCPRGVDVFRAFDMTPPENVRVVILGQDPYHTPWVAMGMSFSVPNGSKPQPSLRNIFKEIYSDIWASRTQTDLSDWANEWVLLLNAVLTVREGEPASHGGKWWENFTDRVIELLSEERDHIVFILWGKFAESKRALIDEKKHLIISSAHPSPFSVNRGFFGSRPFSRTNEFLKKNGNQEVHWWDK